MNELENLAQSIKGLIAADDELFNDEHMDVLLKALDEQFSPVIVNQSINQIVIYFLFE